MPRPKPASGHPTDSSSLAFWLDTSRDLPPTELPIDHPRPPAGPREVATRSILWHASARSEESGSEETATAVLASFAALVGRYTGLDEIALGVRQGDASRLPRRVDLTGNPSFAELVERIRAEEERVREQDADKDATDEDAIDLDLLVATLGADDDPSRHPLFQVAFEVGPPPASTGTSTDASSKAPALDLLLRLHPGDENSGRDEWRLEAEYAEALFDLETIDRLLASCVRLLDAALDAPETPIGALPLLSEEDRRRLLAEWNRTATPFPEDALLIDAVRAQAARTPDAEALVTRDETLSYAELWRRVETLAERLRGLGVGSEIPVLVCLERRAELITTLLAVLEAGGVYVPVDPAYPRERVGFTLEDCRARVVVTTEILVAILPADLGGAALVVLDRDEEVEEEARISPEAPTEPEPKPRAMPENLAYLIYTSGSTGRPKGVAIRNRSAVAMVTWAHGVFSPEETAKTLVATSVCFDLSVYEIFVPLSRGGTLVLAQNALDLADLPAADGVTLVNTVPSAMRELLRDGHLPESVRVVNLAGEALPRDLVDRIYEEPGVEHVYNLYGPSEDTTYSTFARVAAGETPPIGRPVANTRAYVLDQNLRPTPIGVPGELYLAGDGLARGYFGRPGITADRFVPDPFVAEVAPVGAEPGDRMYRTGDLVVYRGREEENGVLHYLGRLDHQVKVRGFRVELGEVEAALGEHEAVKDRVVVASPDPSGALRLVAYVTPTDLSARPDRETLRAFLRERLPEHAVPSVFVVLDLLPLTPNGKVDRKALPEPESLRAEELDAYVAPRTPLEAEVAAQVTEILGLEAAPSMTSDFFVLGGHSLLAMRLASRLRDRFDVDLSVRTVFENPRLEEMAEQIESARALGPGAAPVEVSEESVAEARERGVVSFGQRQLWIVSRLDPDSTAYNLAYALRLRGSLDIDALSRALGEIVRRHEVLRTRLVPSEADDGEPRAVVDPVPAIHLEPEPIAQTSDETGDEGAEAALERTLREAADHPFDLGTGPVLRLRLFRLADDDHTLLFDVHHAAFDGWSLDVLRRELAALYAPGGETPPTRLPEPSIQYADHAAHRRTALRGEALRRLVDAWRERLAGLEPLELPADHRLPVQPAWTAGRQRVPLSSELAAELRERVRSSGQTLFTTGLAAFYALLQVLGARDDLAVGVPESGRDRTEIEGLLGFFVDMLVLRVDLSGDPTFQELVERVRDALLDAQAIAEAPFDEIVEALRPEREARNPLFQVTFQAVEPVPLPDLAELSTSHRELPRRDAQFDLAFDLVDHGPESASMELVAEYADELYDAASVERWLALYARILEQIVRAPDHRLSSLALGVDADHEAIRRANDVATPYPGEVPLYEQFRRRVEATPEKTAVVHGEASLSYADLHERAESLADRLTNPPSGAGVEPGDFVGLVAKRGIGLVEGMLGILAAGGAYVSLDPDYPEDRLRFMIDDAGIRVLLVEPSLRKFVPSVPGVQILELDREARRPARTSTGEACLSEASSGARAQSSRTPTSKDRVLQVDGDFPACLIYTSGSTGTPKASVLAQRGVTRLVVGTNYTTFGPDDVFTQTASPSFDAATFEIWGAMLNGGTLVVVDRDDLLSPEALERTVKENRVSVLFLTTAYFQQIARQAPSVFETTRAVFFGGERCEVDAVRSAAEVCARSGTRLFHAYGPSECTTYATVGEVERVGEDAVSVPIGGPVANTTAHVVDPLGREVGVGVPGELWLGGPGLAHAYHGRARLTAERFVPNPFDGRPGARAYRTGDLVRWLPNGTLDFVGRIDQQVKIRGFRIEPGEIETLLARHPHVGDTAVIVREDEDNRRLVAYATPAEGMHRPKGEALRDFLAEELPDFMVPSAVVVLDALPITPNGKLDRRALPAPELDAAEFVAPRDEIEEAVAEIATEVLKLERPPSMRADFFALGGHSLLAVRLISRLHDRFGIELSVRSIFDAPRLEDLARALWTRAEETVESDGAASSAEAKAEVTAEIRAARERGALSFGQRRLWFLWRLDPESTAYNMPLGLRLRDTATGGTPDREALERALEEIVRRHEILRTRYVDEAGEPRAVVDPPSRIQLDAEPLDAESLDAALRAEAETPFDLERGPVLRPRLFVDTSDESSGDAILLFHVHHIAFDGWSLGVLRRELVALYEHFLSSSDDSPSHDNTSPLVEPPIQYADHAARESVRLDTERLEALVEPWRERLAGLEPLELPADRPWPTRPEHTAAHLRRDLPSTSTDAARDLARRAGRTLVTTLLAAFAATLEALTGRHDFAVGVPEAGRDRTEIEDLVGFFVDMLVLRLDLSGDPSFADLVERTRETLLDAQAHAEAPFEKLVEALAPRRDLDRNPFFQISFQVIEKSLVEEDASDRGRLAVRDLAVALGKAKFDLSVDIVDHGDRLELVVEYPDERFDEATIERWSSLFFRVLAQATADPERRLSALDLPGSEDEAIFERGHLRGTAPDPTAPDPTAPDPTVPEPAATLPALFAERARERGDALAAVYPDGSLSYRDLDARARALAHALVRRGTRPGDLVGSAFGRSIDLLVSMLGIGYAGAAYVPLDPGYPSERLAAMIDDAGLSLVVHRGSEGILPAGVEGLDLGSLDLGRSEEFQPVPVDGEFPAYVLYTSGSTGRPKGVMLPHRAVVNLLADPLHDVGPDDVMAQIASPSFDVSGWEIWLALARGARLVGVTRDDLLEPGGLRRRFEENGVTFADLAAPVFHEVVAEDPEFLGRLRRVFVGADRMDPTATRIALAHGARLVNAYGPTEAAIDSTHGPIETLDEQATSVPIGRGVPNARLHVVDRRGRTVPVGVEGELLIGGPGLAHGYFARPSLTAAAFVPDPFSNEPGTRLYRTGDRVRWLPSGVLDFLGRVDHQVKIRGFRIELGEIESALSEHPAVRHVAVVVRHDLGDAAHLVAWIEAGAETETSRDDLLDHLRERLPAHMIPSAVELSAELPRTPSGKIDRKSLRTAPLGSLGAGQDHVAPRDENEADLAAVWKDVLGIDDPSVTASFFEVGGHSLLATRLVARVRDRFGVDLPVRTIFDAPTIEEQARVFAERRRAARERGEVLGPRAPQTLEAIAGLREQGTLSFGQRRLWFLSRLEPESAAYNMPFVLRLVGDLNRRALERALGEIARRHEILRTRYVEIDGEPRAVVDPPPEVVLDPEPVDSEAVLDAVLEDEARRPFDLEAGPVFRTRLFTLPGKSESAADEHVLVFHVHHIAFDGVSYGLLRRELAALYEAFRETPDATPESTPESRVVPSPLPEPTAQYAEHAARQRARLDADRLDELLDHWRDRLAGLEPLDLPSDRPRSDLERSPAASRRAALSESASRAARELARRRDTTLFTTLLAAFDVLLHALAGRDDLVVGVPEAGRDHSDTEEILGFFVDNLVLRVDLAGDPTFAEVLERVQESFLDARGHSELPFDKLVEALAPRRATGRNPFFDVTFQVLEEHPAPSLPGLEVIESAAHPGEAKFDLAVDVVDRGEGALELDVEWASSLFDESTVERWLALFARIVEQVTAEPERRLSTLDLRLGDDEAIFARGHTRGEVPDPDVTLPGLFAERARERGDALAAVYPDGSLSYRDLDARARVVARALVRRGVRPGELVGSAFGRSIDLLVSMLGIGYAGAAYVPLDPDYPRERLAGMIDDAGLSLVVHRGSAGILPAGVEGLDLGSLDAESSDDFEPIPVDGEFPAYVLYTSGSTGRPKGVMLPHRAVVNLLGDPLHDVGPDDVMAQIASPSFDVSGWEIWLALTRGARLVGVTRDDLLEPGGLRRRFEEGGVTFVDLAAAVFHEVAAEDPELLAQPRKIFVGAERMDPTATRRAIEAGATLINAYGPTETAIDSTFHPVETLAEDATSVPIGRGVPNVRLYVVDRLGRRVPVGVEGELLIGGPALAHGYFRRPSLTAAAFVPDPFTGDDSRTEPGARLYRTGDRVRWLASGVLDFVGRVDHQVKIRGFRVEPGEIESVLAAHPAVRHAAVLAREDAAGTLRLVAWVESDAESGEARGDALLEHLRANLPAHMVPSALQVVAELPRTPSDKIDRRALAARPLDLDLVAGAEHVAPRDENEASLAEIWQEVLGVENPSVTASFFESGGHSLLATRLVARVRDRFGVDLPVRTVFDAPTIEEQARALARIRSDAERSSESDPSADEGFAEAVAEARERGALSFGQRRLVFLQRLEPESTAYNMPLALDLEGELDVAALERALGEIVRRHEILRTRYVPDPERDGEPRAMVDPPSEIDLSPESVPSEEALAERLREEAATPFDLETGPVLRPRLFRRGEREHTLLFHVHHVAFDGTSYGILRRELAALYAGESLGEPFPFAEHAAREAVLQTPERLEARIEPWRQRLAGLEPLELPADHPPPAVPTHPAGTVRQVLPPELSATLRDLARGPDRTLFSTGLATLFATLQVLTHRDDLAIGVPDARRNRTEIENSIGFFVDMLVLRVDLSDDPSFRELARRVRDVYLDAEANADVSFDRLVEALRPERRGGSNPFFQVAFQAMTHDPPPPVGDLVTRDRPVSLESAKFDLTVDLEAEDGGSFALAAEFDAERYDRASVERWLALYRHVLEQAAADPDRRLSRLTLLPAADVTTIARANDVASDFPRELSLYEQFERVAEDAPERPAVVHGAASTSYGDLRERAEALADRLVAAGVRAGDFVGLSVARGARLVEGMLGILAAGGAYVPLDPDYPEDRLRLMIDDTGLRVLVTEPGNASSFADLDVDAVLVSDDEESSIDTRGPASGSTAGDLQNSLRSDKLRSSSFEPDASRSGSSGGDVDGDFPAYVIYTSGSTGRPKGVVVPQRAVTRLVIESNYYQPRPDEVIGQASSASFDAITFEVWGALLGGGTIAVIDRDVLLSPERLADALDEHGVTTLFLTTAYFQELVRQAPRALETLRLVLFGGERCDPATVGEAAAICRAAGTRLLHVYGPTECTTYATFGPVDEVPVGAPSVPIGGPLANTTLHVVDPNGRELGIGVPGELWIGGPGLAHGYHRRPSLSAERFVPNPFVPNPFESHGGERAYRTGDLVRRLADGAIDFLGRIDHQVKLRGFRIEPGEIESVLASHPHVAATLVMVREDVPGDRRLVAYATPAEGAHRPEGEILRDFLDEELPDFMVPAAVVVLDTFPLTPNGKIDRKILPAPDLVTAGGTAYRAPETPLESILAQTWAEVLGVERVGLDDDFFDLGGHSLLAVKIFHRLRGVLGLELPLGLLFETLAVGEMARATEEHLRSTPEGQETLELLEELASLSDEERALLDG